MSALYARRHYQHVADTIRTHLIAEDDITPEFVAEVLAAEFSADNPRFDRARFLDACGVETSR